MSTSKNRYLGPVLVGYESLTLGCRRPGMTYELSLGAIRDLQIAVHPPVPFRLFLDAASTTLCMYSRSAGGEGGDHGISQPVTVTRPPTFATASEEPEGGAGMKEVEAGWAERSKRTKKVNTQYMGQTG